MNKESKQQVVAELHEKLQRAKAVFLADFRGMNVGKATDLRNELRKERISYGEIVELESLAEYIDKEDVELLEAAGVPEFED